MPRSGAGRSEVEPPARPRHDPHPGDLVPTKEERPQTELAVKSVTPSAPIASTSSPKATEFVEVIEQLIETIDPDVEVETCPTEPMDYPADELATRAALTLRPRVMPHPTEPFVSTPERKGPIDPAHILDRAALPPPRRVPRVARAPKPSGASQKARSKRLPPPPPAPTPRPAPPPRGDTASDSLSFESAVEMIEDSLVDTDVVYEDGPQSITDR